MGDICVSEILHFVQGVGLLNEWAQGRSTVVTRCLPCCILDALRQCTGLIFKGQGTVFVISALEDEPTILCHNTGHQQPIDIASRPTRMETSFTPLLILKSCYKPFCKFCNNSLLKFLTWLAVVWGLYFFWQLSIKFHYIRSWELDGPSCKSFCCTEKE